MNKKYQVKEVYFRANEYQVKIGNQPPFYGIFSETRFDLTILDENGSDDFPLFNLYKESLGLRTISTGKIIFNDKESEKRFSEILVELQKDPEFMKSLKDYHIQKVGLLKREQEQKSQGENDGLGLLEQEERILERFISERVTNYKQEDSGYKRYIKEKNFLYDDYATLFFYIQENYTQQTHPLAIEAAKGLYHIQMAREAIRKNDAMKSAYYTGLAVQRRYMSGIHADFEKSHFQAIARRLYGAYAKKYESKGNTKFTSEERLKIVNEVGRVYNNNPTISKIEACRRALKNSGLPNCYYNENSCQYTNRSQTVETIRKWSEIEAIFKK
ncbi:hypothetical protein [Bizionia paragorgiae]|uniref:hypothetical protein n=1 Tax=Bizionia paragorgiae TaxID=283786 RepID=UPI003A959789